MELQTAEKRHLLVRSPTDEMFVQHQGVVMLRYRELFRLILATSIFVWDSTRPHPSRMSAFSFLTSAKTSALWCNRHQPAHFV